MLSLVIKYGFLIFCSVYATIHLTNQCQKPVPSRSILWAILFVFQLVAVVYIRHFSISFGLLSMVLSSMFINTLFLNLTIRMSIPATIIGYGISYILYTGGVLALAAIKFLIGDYSGEVSPLAFSAIGIIQTFLSILLFRMRRLRHGLPFLQSSHHSGSGVCLSVCLLMIASIFGITEDEYHITATLFYLILALGVLLWYWCKNYLSQEYLDQVHKRAYEDLEKALDAAHKENRQLRMENETFSKIIHKDNKLIPAMELAVSQLLYSVAQEERQPSQTQQAQQLLEQLKTLSKERAGIIENYEEANQTLPSLGLGSLDALFRFMMQKANMSGISFDLHLENGISQLLTQTISESDVSTLLADLVENALIATSHSEQEKAVRVKLGVDTDILHISVYDSAPPFPPEVLDRWGVERITTHADAGGSGIGMMTIYELCQKYRASFEIKQTQTISPYRKCIIIRFDGLGTFRVCEIAT